MEFRFNTRISSDFQQNCKPAGQHVFVRVVLIEKPGAQELGRAYQLSPEFLMHPENLRPLKERFLLGHYEGVFLPLGTVEKLNRSHKQIILSEGHVATYEHLIQLNVSHQEEGEFIKALEGLIDALLVCNRQSVMEVLKGATASGKVSAKYDSRIVGTVEGNTPVTPQITASQTPPPLEKRFRAFQL